MRLGQVPRVLFVLILLCVACGSLQLGDPANVVEIHNSSDVPLVVFDAGPHWPNEGWVIQPGEKTKTPWTMAPPNPAGKLRGGRRVEAKDQVGNRVFCRYYNYEELKDAGWRVELTKGDVQCWPLGQWQVRIALAAHQGLPREISDTPHVPTHRSNPERRPVRLA
jgi:hypothetical protein